jgi:hypothetical protein
VRASLGVDELGACGLALGDCSALLVLELASSPSLR